jgi:periplasmic protein TonB
MFSSLSATREPTLQCSTALASFMLEAAIIFLIVAYRLIWPLSLAPTIDPLAVPPPVSDLAPTPPPASTTRPSPGSAWHRFLVTRRSFSFLDPAIDESSDERAPDVNLIGPGVGAPVFPDGVSVGSVLPVLRPPVEPHSLRQSTVVEAHLLRKVEPEYPPLARQMHLEGVVVLKALISRQGTVESLEVERGHPVLARAAFEAVRQWLYRPCYLNHQAIEVEIEITVNFRLAR